MSVNIKLESLEAKMPVKGTVKRLELFGAFIDIGSDVDALLHISKLGSAKINDINQVLSVGQEIDAWILSVDQMAKRIALTMRKPTQLEWNDIKVGSVYEGTVARIDNFGVFVDIGAERFGLVRNSELGHEYRDNPQASLALNSPITVTVLKVNRDKRQIDLTARTSESPASYRIDEDDSQEPLPTAMEIALQRARAVSVQKSEDEHPESVSKAKGKKQAKLNNILRRTLDQRTS